MPYVLPQDRNFPGEPLDPHTVGQLNYGFTVLAQMYLDNLAVDVDYEALNGVIGAFESAKQEFYRRLVVPYEEVKRAQNGDVYALRFLPTRSKPEERIEAGPWPPESTESASDATETERCDSTEEPEAASVISADARLVRELAEALDYLKRTGSPLTITTRSSLLNLAGALYAEARDGTIFP